MNAYNIPVPFNDISDIKTNTSHKPIDKIIAPMKTSNPVFIENLTFIPPMEGTKVASITEENAIPIRESNN